MEFQKSNRKSDFWNSRNTDYFYYNPDLWNSNYIVYYFSFPICWIPKIGTIFKIFDLCISRSTSYFWNGTISGIPIVGTIWSAYRFLEFQKYGNCISTNTFQSTIQKWPYPICIEQSNILPMLQGICRVPFSLFSPYFRRNFRGPRSTNCLTCFVFSREYRIHLKYQKSINTIHQDKSQFLVELSQLENLQPLGNAKSSTKDLCSLTNQTRRDFPTISRIIVFLSNSVVNWTVVDLTLNSFRRASWLEAFITTTPATCIQAVSTQIGFFI